MVPAGRPGLSMWSLQVDLVILCGPYGWTWFLHVADLQVVDQVLPPGEGPPAETTAVWSVPTVDLQVSLQTLLPAEVPAAEPTAVRFFPSVDPFVDLHPLDGAALLSTHVTGATQLFVGPQVVSQDLGGLQTVPTGPTPALGLLAVVLCVPDQNPLSVEGTPADPADEGLGRTLEGGPLSAEAAGHQVLVLRRVSSDVFSQSST